MEICECLILSSLFHSLKISYFCLIAHLDMKIEFWEPLWKSYKHARWEKNIQILTWVFILPNNNNNDNQTPSHTGINRQPSFKRDTAKQTTNKEQRPWWDW